METAKNKKLMEELRRQIPSKEVMERADNYLRQLRRDNGNLVTRDFTVTRIDGLTVILQSPKGLKVRQRGYFDKKENAVEWQYEVIEKP